MTELSVSFSRRSLLQAGLIGAAGTFSCGLTLPELLAAERQSANPSAGSARSCIFIYQYGGLSQLDSWDPKPAAPDGIRGPYKPIATRTPGFQVGELMPRLAELSDKYCVIRSMSHSVPVHNVANEMLLAGKTSPAKSDPSFGSMVARLRPAETNVPAHVWLQKFGGGAAPAETAWLSGGSLGIRFAPLVLGERHDDHPAIPGYRARIFETATDLSDHRLLSRRMLLQQLDPPHTAGDHGTAPQALQRMQEKAWSLLQGSEARRAFQIEDEPVNLRDRYGWHPFGQNLLMARRLIEAGVRLVNVVAWMGLAPGDKFVSVESWDMHGNAGIGIFDRGWNGLGWALPRLDESLAALLQDLEERGLLETTLVVLIGEFGRTPKISRGASAIGRDHWPNCYSAMLAGAGIRGGTVYGESDETAAWVRSHPVSLESFTATLLTALGIDPASRLSPDGFTMPASTGQSLTDLF